MNLNIGMRTIKTAVSVFLCVLISQILNMQYPFYAAIAAIITTGNSMVSSWRIGKNRMLGTTVGAFIGLIFASVQPNNAILCGIGVIIIIYVCNSLKLDGSISIAGIVFLAIMVNMNGKSPLQYSFNRIIDTFLGITVALLVNHLLFQNDHIKKLLKGCENLSSKLDFTIQQLLCKDIKSDLSNFNNELSSLKEKLKLCIAEQKFKNTNFSSFTSIEKKLELFSEINQHLNIILNLQERALLNEDNIESLKQLNYSYVRNVPYEHNDINIIYNYHVRIVIKKTEQLRLC